MGLQFLPCIKYFSDTHCLHDKVLFGRKIPSDLQFSLISPCSSHMYHCSPPICPTHCPNNPELLKFRTVEGFGMLHDILQTIPSARNVLPATLPLICIFATRVNSHVSSNEKLSLTSRRRLKHFLLCGYL